MLLYLMLLETDQERDLFLGLYNSYHKKLYRIALSILGSNTLAVESLQNAFLKIALHFKKISSLERREMEAYMVSIIEHDALDVLKKESQTAELDETWDTPDPGASPEEESSYLRLVAIIRSMPETYREALFFKFVCEWSDEEIAAHLHVKLGTVTSRISRGRALLIEKLEAEGYHRDRR